MSFALISSLAKEPKTGVLVDTKWATLVEKEVELAVHYKHTVRVAPVMLDATGSTKASAQAMTGYELFLPHQPEGEEDASKDESKKQFVFAGTERHWNNEIRKLVITEGLEHFVPQILYLMRPETAYVSCLHYLAKELGGHSDYDHQRNFIFKNPGIQTLMTKFWDRVQEIYWSGGFTPILDENQRLLLLLALVECFTYSKYQEPKEGETSLCCPHMDPVLLHAAGVYIPSIEFPDLTMTPESMDRINTSQKRPNLPGLPSDFSNYVHCPVCGSNFTKQAEMIDHLCTSGPINCEGCGLSFPNPGEYKIHSVSFCKQGPLSQSKCPVCNTPGPKCICQVHWNRTYGLVSSLFEGTYKDGAWLKDKNYMAGTLIDVSTYLGHPLIHMEKNQRTVVPTPPCTLSQSLWNRGTLKIPKLVETSEKNFSPMIPYMENDPEIRWVDMITNMAQTLDIEVRVMTPPEKPDPEAPNSTRKAQTKRRLFEYKYLGTDDIESKDDTTLKDLENLDNKIRTVEKKLKVDSQAALMSIAMGKTKEQILTEVEKLKELRSQVAISLADRDDEETEEPNKRVLRGKYLGIKVYGEKDRKEHIGFDSADSWEDMDSEDQDDSDGNKSDPDPKDEDKDLMKILKDRLELKNKNGKTEKEKKKDKNFKAKEKDPKLPQDKKRYLCQNETHLTETPPYRVFLTEAAKTAHLARYHHCPYKKDSPPCLFYYEKEEELGKHLLSKHPLPSKDEACPICGTTVKKESLNNHMEAVHVQCPTCHQWYEGLEELKSHWDEDGGTCRTAPKELTPKKKAGAIRPPESLTLAKLPDIQSSHENFLTEAMGMMLDAVFPKGQEEQKEKAKSLISSYSFHQAHLSSISRNPYKAMSQTQIFLEQPNFNHGVMVKERSFDKALDKVQITDLSPFVNRRFENYLLADALNHKITSYTKQYMLSETSAVYLFISHLSQENQDTLRSNYRRNPQDLSYNEVCSGLQFRYFNIELRLLRDGVANLRKGSNEHAIQFHNRAYKLCSLASINFPEHQRADWIEEKVREVFYKSLDNVLKLEVDQMEAKHGIQMSSAELLETYICRANLRSNPVDLNGDTLLGVARVKDSKEPAPKSKKVNIVTSFGALDVKPEAKKKHKEPTRRNPPRKTKADTTKEEAARNRAAAKVTTEQDKKGEREGSYSTPEQRLRRNPSPIGKRERLGLYKGTDQPNRSQGGPQGGTGKPKGPYAPRKISFWDKQESLDKLMKTLELTPARRAELGIHCWACGKGRKGFDEREPHTRKDCHLPFYNGPPHNCAPGVLLMHREEDCPRKTRTVRRLRLED